MQVGTTLCTWGLAASAGKLEEEKRLPLDQPPAAAAQVSPGEAALGFVAGSVAAPAVAGA